MFLGTVDKQGVQRCKEIPRRADTALRRFILGEFGPQFGLDVRGARHGGLSADTSRRLAAIAAELPPKGAQGVKAGKRTGGDRPVSGTRLIREWKGVEHLVTVRGADFEY